MKDEKIRKSNRRRRPQSLNTQQNALSSTGGKRMMRKVAQIGPTTLMISLPSQWVKDLRIKKGDELNVLADGNMLTIRKSEPSKESRQLRLDFREVPTQGMMWREFMAAYRSGADIITIAVDPQNHKLVEEIKAMVSEFIGIEIMDQSPQSFTIREISEVKPEEFENILKKTFLSLIQTGEDLLTAIEQKKKKEIFSLVGSTYDVKINRFTDYGIRILNKEKMNFNRVIHYKMAYFIILESIGDRWKEIAREFAATLPALPEEGNGVKKTTALLKSGYDIFYQRNEEKIRAFHIQKAKCADDLQTYSQKNKKHSFMIMLQLTELVNDLIDLRRLMENEEKGEVKTSA